jgi:LacI family transcriptional regulator
VWPELTTIPKGLSAMAAAAIYVLVGDWRSRRRADGGLAQEMVLDHELVIRESSAPPPGESRPYKLRGSRA